MNTWIPAPPTMSDKFVDWEVLVAAGGEWLFRDRKVVDCGPAWGVEAFIFGKKARPWLCVDSSKPVLAHVEASFPWCVAFDHDIREPWPEPLRGADTVIDFSSFDDTGNALLCFEHAAVALRSGGTLVTTFGNKAVGGTIQNGVDWVHPADLIALLARFGFTISHRLREDQARAGLVAVKK